MPGEDLASRRDDMHRRASQAAVPHPKWVRRDTEQLGTQFAKLITFFDEHSPGDLLTNEIR